MNLETISLLKLQYEFNQNIIAKKLVGYGVSQIENDLINKITISEKIDLSKSLELLIEAQHNLESGSGKQ